MRNTNWWLTGGLITTLTLALAACGTDGFSPTESTNTAGSSGVGAPSGADVIAINAAVRIRCERRASPARSRVSVDGRALTAGRYTARIRSGSNTASAPSQAAVAGQAEFDFDSDPGNIAAGATPIAAGFISQLAGADLQAQVLNASGQVVASGAVDCQFR